MTSMLSHLLFGVPYVGPLKNLRASYASTSGAGFKDLINDQPWPYSEMGISRSKEL